MDSKRPPLRLAFIGSAGIPNRYGGFESFLEHCAPELSRNGHEVRVTCDGRLYPGEPAEYVGTSRVFIGVPANGAFSPLHDLIAFSRIFRQSDVIFVLGVSAGPFLPWMRMLAGLAGKRLVVNLDGIEWRRNKHSRVVRLLLRAFDLLGQMSAHRLIYDNQALLPYVMGRFRHKAVLIAYPGDYGIRFPGERDPMARSALTICRIEPENQLEMLIEAALASSIKRYTIIGNWRSSVYGRHLMEIYSSEPRLDLLDPIYDPEALGRARESCTVYLHGHRVGGTNPSLVEILPYECAVICFDCAFNRATAGARAFYFQGTDDLPSLIDETLNRSASPWPEPPSVYTVAGIAKAYSALASP